MNRHEVVVVGGGHNGLSCAAYLARAGVDVLVLEQRHIVGGPCAEYEYFPGYRASITNSPGSLEPKIVSDLELERFGLTFTRPNPSLMFPFPDGRAFVAWREPERVAEQIRSFSEKDVEGYSALFEFFNRFAERLGVSLFEAPPTLAELTARLATPEDEEAFAKVYLGTVVDLLDEYLESEHLKAMVAMLGVMSNWLGPLSPGSAVWLMMRPMSLASSTVAAAHDPRRQVLRGSTGLPLGGMGSIVRTMRQFIEAAGGKVRTGARVTRILAGERGASGVVLEDGEEIEAAAVVSNLGPWTTFLDLVDARHLDAEFRAKVENLPKKGLRLQVRPRPRRPAPLRGIAEGNGGGVLGLPVPDRPQHRVPGARFRRREVRALVARTDVLGPLPHRGRPPPSLRPESTSSAPTSSTLRWSWRRGAGIPSATASESTASSCSASTCRGSKTSSSSAASGAPPTSSGSSACRAPTSPTST